jgi:hypothetical protein
MQGPQQQTSPAARPARILTALMVDDDGSRRVERIADHNLPKILEYLRNARGDAESLQVMTVNGRVPRQQQILEHASEEDVDLRDRFYRFWGGEALPITRRAVPIGSESPVMTISIVRDAMNVNLRALYEEMAGCPIPYQRIHFRIEPGVTIWSSSPELPALRTGPWPDRIILTLINRGCIFGAGGGAS